MSLSKKLPSFAFPSSLLLALVFSLSSFSCALDDDSYTEEELKEDGLFRAVGECPAGAVTVKTYPGSRYVLCGPGSGGGGDEGGGQREGGEDVVFLGDSNTFLNYLLPENPQIPALDRSMRFSEIFERQSGLEVENASAGGSMTRDFVGHGRWAQKWKGLDGHYYIISFGLNDMRNTSAREFEQLTNRLIQEIQAEDGIPVLMTNAFVDYEGGHFSYDHNRKIAPYTDVYRRLAAYNNIGLIDIGAATRSEFQRGRWDFFVNNGRAPFMIGPTNVDPRKIGNVHYNLNGSKLVAGQVRSFFLERNMGR